MANPYMDGLPIPPMPEFEKMAPAVQKRLYALANDLAAEMTQEQTADSISLEDRLKPYDNSAMIGSYRRGAMSGVKGKIGDAANIRIAAPQTAPGMGIFASGGDFLHQGVGFPGFPYLAALPNEGDFQNILTTKVDGVLRSWGRWVAHDEVDEASKERIDALNAALDEFGARDCLREMTRHDVVYGMGFALAVMKGDDDDETGETETPLTLTKGKLGEGCLARFKAVDPTWISPDDYSTSNAASDSYYKPRRWWVQGTSWHGTRCMTLISRPVSDIFKPSYNFAGMSLLFMAKTYVDNWRKTRDNVTALLSTMRTTILETDLTQIMSAQGRSDLKRRAHEFIAARNNMGLMLTGKEERVNSLNTPLSGLDRLQAQALEQICNITQTTVMEFTGNQPTGLNASSEGALRLSDDRKKSFRQLYLEPLIHRMSDILQFHLWGEIKLKSGSIRWDWDAISEPSPSERADMGWNDARGLAELVDQGIISPEDARRAMIRSGNRLALGIEDEEIEDFTSEDPAP